MKVPTQKWRNMETLLAVVAEFERLNESLHLKVQNKRSHGHLEGIVICLIESPYKIVGKSRQGSGCDLMLASLNESPHSKVEKCRVPAHRADCLARLIESPHPKVEKFSSASKPASRIPWPQ